jgi:hypothetical protein
MKWKEDLNQCSFDDPEYGPLIRLSVAESLITEIIEKLIEDIPDSAYIEINPSKSHVYGNDFKQQLRERWLNDQRVM